MSDIQLFPPEFGVILVSVALLGLTAVLALIFLVVGLLTQKNLPFGRRYASCLLVGMPIPAILASLTWLLAAEGPASVKEAMGKIPDWGIFFSAFFFLFLGIIFGLLKIKLRKK